MNRIVDRWKGLRRLTQVNLIVGGFLLLVFGYVSVTLYFGAASQVRYESNDFPGAKKAATTFLRLSPIERHIGYFNRGTAEAAVGDFDPAKIDLEAALEITPQRDECAVRINLSYVYEKLADEVVDQDAKKSDELYAQAMKTLEDAPAECQPDKSEEQQKSNEAKERVKEKQEGQESEEGDSSGDSGGSDQGDDTGDTGDKKDKKQPDDGKDDSKSGGSGEDEQKSEQERKRDELRQRGEQSDRDQQQQGSGGDGGRSTPDKPW